MIKNLNPNLRLIDCHEATHAKAILDILNEAIINSTALYDYLPRSEESMKNWFSVKRKWFSCHWYCR